jgi:hypothetical protein
MTPSGSSVAEDDGLIDGVDHRHQTMPNCGGKPVLFALTAVVVTQLACE